MEPWIVERQEDGRWAVLRPLEAGRVVDSASWLTETAARQRAETLNRERTAQEATSDAVLAAAGATEGSTFYAVLCVDEYESADGRYFEHFEWETLPLALWTLDSNEGGGHYGAEASGSIRTIERLSDNRRIFATGVFSTTEEGQQTETQVREQVLRFISVDPADYECEEEITVIGTDGWPIDGRLRFTNYVIGGATVLGNPAIRLAVIWLDGMDPPAELTEVLPDPVARVQVPEIVDVSDEDDIIVIMASANATQREPATRAAILAGDRADRALIASARAELEERACVLTRECGGPALPPAEWFEDPQLSEPTPLQITDDGRIFGHVALFDVPHRGFLHYEWSERIYAPRSTSGYRQFLTRPLEVACCADPGCGHERQRLLTGPLTFGTLHADARMTYAAAQAFYENSGLQGADVVAGDDQFGPWVSGALRPGMDDSRIREVLGSTPSGDWRWIGGQLELIAVLGVNTGGIPVIASAYEEQGETRTVIAGWGRPQANPDEALVASAAARLRSHPPAARADSALMVVERARFERLEADVAELRPLVADRIADRLAPSLR